MARTEPDNIAIFNSMPGLKDLIQRAAKALAGDPLTLFNLLMALLKSICPRENIYFKGHFMLFLIWQK
jgi:hypothetical protein